VGPRVRLPFAFCTPPPPPPPACPLTRSHNPHTTLTQRSHHDSTSGLNDYLDKLGLGILSQQLKDLDLGELLDTPPPGVDEAIAISKV
jgi:hypothetical protein